MTRTSWTIFFLLLCVVNTLWHSRAHWLVPFGKEGESRLGLRLGVVPDPVPGEPEDLAVAGHLVMQGRFGPGWRRFLGWLVAESDQLLHSGTDPEALEQPGSRSGSAQTAAGWTELCYTSLLSHYNMITTQVSHQYSEPARRPKGGLGISINSHMGNWLW